MAVSIWVALSSTGGISVVKLVSDGESIGNKSRVSLEGPKLLSTIWP